MREHWQLPVAASALLHSPEFVLLPRRKCELRLLIEGDDGAPRGDRAALQRGGILQVHFPDLVYCGHVQSRVRETRFTQ